MIGNKKSEISVLVCDDSMWLYVGVALDYPEYVPLLPLQQTRKWVLERKEQGWKEEAMWGKIRSILC